MRRRRSSSDGKNEPVRSLESQLQVSRLASQGARAGAAALRGAGVGALARRGADHRALGATSMGDAT